VADVAVLGASGYAGAIAAALLHRHPFFDLRHVTARSESGALLEQIHPRTRVPLVLEDYDPDVQGEVDAALVCWPHGVSAPAVAALRERGVRVVDLSADFRLRDRAVYEDWYGEHGAPELFGDGIYGLPELYRQGIPGSDLVANPGCYPTAALLALAPLAPAGLIADVVIDAKSGVSGAGREPSQTTHFVTADENMTPYKVERHRHTPEIEQELARLAGTDLAVQFTPHLIPMTRGILATCYGRLAPGVTTDDSRACFEEAYGHEPFVDLLPPGQWPRTRAVATTNRAQVAVVTDRRTGRAVAAASIDNLVKGAAGQAVQCANIALGLPETAGLDLVPPGP
jgi:N-acetyl-gamma-glutamyl-phosphate reductase